jgi:hypothetical protein
MNPIAQRFRDDDVRETVVEITLNDHIFCNNCLEQVICGCRAIHYYDGNITQCRKCLRRRRRDPQWGDAYSFLQEHPCPPYSRCNAIHMTEGI